MKKNKNFLKKLTAGILGFVMTLGVGAAGYAASATETKAGDTVINIASLYNNNKITINSSAGTASFTSGDFTVTALKNTGQTAPTVNASAKDMRLYAKATLSITSSSAMTAIDFGVSTAGAKRLATITSNSGTMTLAANTTCSWTGNTNNVVFTVGDKATYGSDGASKAGQLCFDTITITTSSSPTPSSFSMTTNFTNCSWDGEETFDGSEDYVAEFEPDDGYDSVELDSVVYTGGSDVDSDLYLFEDNGLLIDKSALTAGITVTAHGVSSPGPSGEDIYQLVTEEPDDWSGTYLLEVNKFDTLYFWGGTTTASDNYETEYYDEDNHIVYKPDSACELLIAPYDGGGYSIKLVGGTKNGNYIDCSGSSGIRYNPSAAQNTIGFTTAKGKPAVLIDSNSLVLTYNYNNQADIIKYYSTTTASGSSYSYPALYKKVEPQGTIDEVTITTQPTDLEYNAGECFNPAGLVAHVTYVEEEFEPEDIIYGDDTAELFTFEPSLETPLTKTDSEVLFSYKDVTASVSIEITVNGIHKVTITGENSVYAGESITLSASCIDGDNVTTWLYGDDTSSQHITITGNGSTATIKGKKVGKATVKAKCANGTESDPFEITIASKPAGYALVTDAASLSAGDKLILGATVDGKGSFAAGAFGTDKFFSSKDASVSEDGIITCADAIIITLGGTVDAWTLTTSEGLVGTSAAKALNIAGTGTTTWTISIGSESPYNATITSTDTDCGSIYYNSGSPRFLNYTSAQSKVQLYRLQYNDSIKYDANGGTGSTIRDENIYEEGDPFTAKPLTFTRQYYTATGWNTAKDGTGTSYTPSQSYTFESNMTLYAQWQGDQYTITYKNMSGSAFDGTHGDDYPTTHTYGSVTTLDTPTKTGYTFSGWFTDSACTGNPITTVGATDKTSDFTLYAKWDAVTNSIKYLLPDGSAASGTWASGKVTSRTYGTETTLTTVSKTGYTFGGYYANAQLTGDPITKIGATEHPETGDINLYVKWTVKNHSITYYDRNENNDPVPYSGSNASLLPSNFDYDKGVTLVDGAKEHYTFKGWFSSYASTSKITAIAGDTPNNDKDFVLYAKWEADVYNLTYKYKNASGVWTDYTGAGVAKTHTYGTETTLSAPTGLSGYSFNGFYSDQALTNKITKIGADQITAAMTIYMDTEISEFTLQYKNIVDGDLPAGMPTTHTYGTATTLPAAIDKADGTYEFKGWYFNENLTTRVPGDLGNQQIPANKTGTDGVLQLYAKWEGSDHNITYKDQGDKTFSGTHEDGYAKKYTYGTAVDLDSPTKTGYDFNGYYNDSGCEGTRVLSILADHAPEAITVYAKWTAQTYTITYSGAETDYTLAVDSPTSHTYDTVTELKAPSKDGFTFQGWYTSPSFSGDPISSIGKTAITTNITLYAKFVFGAQDGLDALNKDIGMSKNYSVVENPVSVCEYQKITSTDDLESGTYLIVAKKTNSDKTESYYCFNGGLTDVTVTSNNISVSPNNNVIAKTPTVDAATFTYDASKNTLKSASGYYIGSSSNNNGMDASKTYSYTNTISFNSDGNADIVGSGGAYLRFNPTDGSGRFRYFKSSTYTGQTAVQLYKLVDEPGNKYDNVDFRFNLKFAGLQSFAEDNNVDADYGIKLTMTENETVRERYFSLKNRTITEDGVDGTKEFNYQGSANNGQLTLLLGDVLNEGSKDYHSPDIMFKIQLYVVDDKGNKYESTTFVEYSVKSWVEYYHSISKYAAATQQLYDIFFPSEK